MTNPDSSVQEIEKPAASPADDDVFLSYSAVDIPWVQSVSSALKASGLKTFDPKEALPAVWGQDRRDFISAMFPARCRFALVVMSAAYFRSPESLHELGLLLESRETGRAVLLPARLDDSPAPPPIDQLIALDVRGLAPGQVAERVVAAVRFGQASNQHNSETHVDPIEIGRPSKEAVPIIPEWHPELYPYAFRLAKRYVDEDDVAQEIALTSLSSLSRFQRNPQETPSALMTEVAAMVRRLARIDVRTSRGHEESGEATISERTEVIRDAVAQLPDTSRKLIEMRYFAGLSITEIADTLCLSAGSVRFRLHRAKRELHDLVGDLAG